MADNIFGGKTLVQLATPEKCGTISAMTYKIRFAEPLSKASTGDPGVKFEDLIVQDIQASVNVAVQTYYEIGSRKAHRVVGRPQGQGSLNNVVGPCDAVLNGLVKLCQVCKPKDLITASYNGCANKEVKGMRFTDCICTGVSMSMNAQQDIVNGQWSLLFCDLFRDTGSSSGTGSKTDDKKGGTPKTTMPSGTNIDIGGIPIDISGLSL